MFGNVLLLCGRSLKNLGLKPVIRMMEIGPFLINNLR